MVGNRESMSGTKESPILEFWGVYVVREVFETLTPSSLSEHKSTGIRKYKR